MKEEFGRQVAAWQPADPQFATRFVAALFEAGLKRGASDLHLVPAQSQLNVWWRVDGVLQELVAVGREAAAAVVARLKVLADLLTYRTDIPQEGRLRDGPEGVEMRLSTFPTLYGEKAVIRIFSGTHRLARLDDLGLAQPLHEALGRLLLERGGMLLLAGPTGSGKTTTMYACLRELVAGARPPRSIVTLEDPIEAVVPGAAQSQVQPAVGFDLARGLRSLLRQDPDVIAVGEIRDREAAEIAFQAALAGSLVLTTFHAPSAAGAVSRLCDMGIEPYLMRSGIRALLAQHLLRRLCGCAEPSTDPADRLGLPVEQAWRPRGCPDCDGSGYRGRMVVAELLSLENPKLGRAVLARRDADRLETLAIAAGMVSRWQRASEAVQRGQTSAAEVRRVLGLRDRF